MAKALERYARKRLGENPSVERIEVEAKDIRQASGAFRILASKDLGVRLLLGAAWKQLGIGKALSAYEKKHRCEFPIERIVFAMVLNRLVDPMSKRACNEWLQSTAYFPEAEKWQVQHFYRALDVLHEHWRELEKLLGDHLFAELDDDEKRLQLVDTTTLYFEARQNDREIGLLAEDWDAFDEDDDARAPRRPRPSVVNETNFRMQGHNKDGKPGNPQVVIASVCTPGGLVLSHRVYPGNTSDVTVARDLIEELPPPEGAERVWVSDAGMVSKELLGQIDGAGWKRVSAEAPRKSALGQQLMSEAAGRYRKHPDKPDFGFKVFDVSAADSPSGVAERWVITRNERDRERQLEKIAAHIERVKATLAKQGASGHPKSVCEVASHVSLKKYVKPSENVAGAFVLDQEAIRREEKLAGVRFYRTTKLDWDGPAIIDAYGRLQDVEAKHRQYKSVLLLRPCYHRSEGRIRAHVMLTILAANCAYYLERKTGRRFEDLVKLFGGLKAAEVQQGRTHYWQHTELSKDQEAILKALDARIPAPVWSEWIDKDAPKPAPMKKQASRPARRSKK